MHPKMKLLLQSKSESEKPAIASRGGDNEDEDYYMDTPIPGFYSNQELVNLNLPERVFLR